MELPKLSTLKRDAIFPPGWDWQRDNGTSIMAVYEPILSAVLPKATPGAIALILSELDPQKGDKARIVCFDIELFQDAGELLHRLIELQRALDTGSVYLRLSVEERDFIRLFNERLGHRQKIVYEHPPQTTGRNGRIEYHLNLFRELSRPNNGIIYFPPGSESVAVMNAVPQVFERPPTDIEYPAQAAVVYGVCSAYLNRPEEPILGRLQPKNTYDPFECLKTLSV